MIKSNISPTICPFTVVIDTAETHPFSFHGLISDADKDNRPLIVKVRSMQLGRHPLSFGDYSIAGCTQQSGAPKVVGVERKSMEDCISTILGWDSNYHVERGLNGRRKRFEQELLNLAAIHSGAVVVECPFDQCLLRMPGCNGEDYHVNGELNGQYGTRTVAENRKSFYRSVMSYYQRPEYKGVRWIWSTDRRWAEKDAFQFLRMFWKHLTKQERMAAMERAGESV